MLKLVFILVVQVVFSQFYDLSSISCNHADQRDLKSVLAKDFQRVASNKSLSLKYSIDHFDLATPVSAQYQVYFGKVKASKGELTLKPNEASFALQSSVQLPLKAARVDLRVDSGLLQVDFALGQLVHSQMSVVLHLRVGDKKNDSSASNQCALILMSKNNNEESGITSWLNNPVPNSESTCVFYFNIDPINFTICSQSCIPNSWVKKLEEHLLDQFEEGRCVDNGQTVLTKEIDMNKIVVEQYIKQDLIEE